MYSICKWFIFDDQVLPFSDVYGKNNQEMVMVDQIVDTCIDMYDGLVKAMFAPDEEQKVNVNMHFAPSTLLSRR